MSTNTEPAANTAPRLAIWPKRMLYLAYGCAAVITGSGFGLRLWQIAGLLLPLVAVEYIFRTLVARRMPLFEGELMARIKDGASVDELLELFQGHHLLRFAAPRHQMQGKLGLIHSVRGRHRRAAVAYREALEDAPPKEAFPLALGLADALYDAGDHEEAEQVYRQSMDEEQRSGRGCANLARLIWRRGGDLREAEEYMRHALDLSPGVELRCELVRLLAEQDRKEDATWELQLATEAAAQGEITDAEQQALDEAKAAVDAGGNAKRAERAESAENAEGEQGNAERAESAENAEGEE